MVLCGVVYSVGPPEIVDPLIYDGLVEELVEVLEIRGTDIMVRGLGGFDESMKFSKPSALLRRSRQLCCAPSLPSFI